MKKELLNVFGRDNANEPFEIIEIDTDDIRKLSSISRGTSEILLKCGRKIQVLGCLEWILSEIDHCEMINVVF